MNNTPQASVRRDQYPVLSGLLSLPSPAKPETNRDRSPLRTAPAIASLSPVEVQQTVSTSNRITIIASGAVVDEHIVTDD